MGKGGRPKGAISETTRIALKLREKLAQEVEKRFPDLKVAMFDSALGHYIKETTSDGDERIYRKSPDTNMLKYLGDQIVGKAKDTIEVNNPKENEAIQDLTKKLNSIISNVKTSGRTEKISD
jgi:deoxyribodipyrimidine photolyase-like uncharacterized protein